MSAENFWVLPHGLNNFECPYKRLEESCSGGLCLQVLHEPLKRVILTGTNLRDVEAWPRSCNAVQDFGEVDTRAAHDCAVPNVEVAVAGSVLLAVEARLASLRDGAFYCRFANCLCTYVNQAEVASAGTNEYSKHYSQHITPVSDQKTSRSNMQCLHDNRSFPLESGTAPRLQSWLLKFRIIGATSCNNMASLVGDRQTLRSRLQVLGGACCSTCTPSFSSGYATLKHFQLDKPNWL